MPTLESDDPQKSVMLALQHLFYELQYQNTSVETKDLLKALDWDCNDVFLQYDVLEIQHALFGKLAEQDRNGRAKNCIFKLFMGEYSNYIKSPTSPEALMHKQSYVEISIDALECRDIYASLEKFCQTNSLEQDDQRRKISHTLVQPKQYALFDSFPTILLFNLKRFHYNRDRSVILKISSPFKFYDELNLDYNDRILLSEDADGMIENKYKLHSVLVDEQYLNEESYCVYIRRDEKWFKVNNIFVKEVSAEEAINGQFGDQNGTSSANFSKGFGNIKKSATVMLVYIRKSEWGTVMCDARKASIPKQIQVRLDKERIAKEERQKQKQVAHLYVIIKLATEFHFVKQIGKSKYLDLVDLDVVDNYRIHKKTSFEDFKEMVSKDFGIAKHLQRFWLWTPRTDDIIQVCEPLTETGHDLKTVLDLRHFRDETLPFDEEKTALMTIRLFLETPEGSSLRTDGNLHTIRQDDLLIFLKYYDPEMCKLSYLGHMFVKKTCPFRLIFEKAKRMAGLAPEEKIIGFKECNRSSYLLSLDLDPETRPEKNRLIQGDIIIVQKVATNCHCELQTVKSYLKFVLRRNTVNFRPLKNPKDKGFDLNLLKTMDYNQVTCELAKYLQIDDPKKLRLTQHNINTCMPCRCPIKYNGMDSLQQMILYEGQYTNIIYYEVLDMQLPYLETLKCFTIGFHNAQGELQSKHQLKFVRVNKVSDLVNALKKQLGEEYNDCDMRIMETFSSRVVKILTPESLAMELDCCESIYRAEAIPEDQRNLQSDEFLVLFCHCKADDNRVTVFGDPLWVKVKLGETVREVKAPVQKHWKSRMRNSGAGDLHIMIVQCIQLNT